MVNATTSDGNSSDTTCQGGKMERNYKDDGSSTKMNRLEINENGPYEIQDHREKQKYNNTNKYPQVRKTGVDAVHEKAAHRWSIS